MYLSELLTALRRRLWLVVLGVAATVGLCVGAYLFVPSRQEIHASMLVLPPKTTTDVVKNPLLALGDLGPAADVLARAMSSGEISDELAPTGSTGEYSVDADSSNRGPVLTITASDETAAAAEALLDAAVARTIDEFAQLQSTVNVPGSATMKILPLARETRSTESNKSQLRALSVAAVGGLSLTIFGTNLLDGLLRRRQGTRKGDDEESEYPPLAEEQDDDLGTEELTEDEGDAAQRLVVNVSASAEAGSLDATAAT